MAEFFRWQLEETLERFTPGQIEKIESELTDFATKTLAGTVLRHGADAARGVAWGTLRCALQGDPEMDARAARAQGQLDVLELLLESGFGMIGPLRARAKELQKEMAAGRVR